MSNQIRIDDLAAPVLSDIQRMGVEYGETKATELTVDAVCQAAQAKTALDDFGPDDFRERLHVQLSEMDADPERTGLGRMLMFGDDMLMLLVFDQVGDMPLDSPDAGSRAGKKWTPDLGSELFFVGEAGGWL